MRRIKTGVVGFGRLGTIHAEDIAFSIPNSELYAICRKDPDKKTDHIFDGVKYTQIMTSFLMILKWKRSALFRAPICTASRQSRRWNMENTYLLRSLLELRLRSAAG